LTDSLFCMVCRGEIPLLRARSKKARTCSDQCQAEYRNRMRQERAGKKCRLCGRAFRRKREGGVVLMEHNGFTEEVGALGAD
jgi:hypothetical protein